MVSYTTYGNKEQLMVRVPKALAVALDVKRVGKVERIVGRGGFNEPNTDL